MLFLLILLIALVAQFFLPWWILAVVAFGLAFWLATSAGRAFSAGFAGIAVGWLAMSLFIHLRTGGILTNRVANLFPVHSAAFVLLLTVLVGGLVGGVAAATGYWCRRAFWPVNPPKVVADESPTNQLPASELG